MVFRSAGGRAESNETGTDNGRAGTDGKDNGMKDGADGGWEDRRRLPVKKDPGATRGLCGCGWFFGVRAARSVEGPPRVPGGQ